MTVLVELPVEEKPALRCHTAPVARRVTCPSFVGREAELKRLESAAEAALADSQLVLLSGDAGVGKTRLIEELCTRWRARGGGAAIGGCVDLGELGTGYAPLVELLRRLRDDVGPDVLDRELHEAAPELLPLLTHDGQHVRQGAVLAHTLALMERLGERLPGLIMVFEDVHWADASTRDLLAFLGRNLRRAKVALIVSYRTDDVHRRHPLRPLLSELARSPRVEHVQLDGMTRSELTVLLAGVAGIVPSDAVVDEVMARSEGIPFYAEELLAARAGAEPLPATLRDAILVRVGRLPEPVQKILREAALLGGHVEEGLLSAVSGRPLDEITDALREAVAHQILVAEPLGCRFRHALVRETLHDDLLPGERQRLHEAAATAMAAQPELTGGGDHVRWAQLAHHWDAAEDQPHAFAASVQAAITAEEVGAMANAAAHYKRAVELWPRVPEPEVAAGMTQCDLLVRAADATSHAGSPALAVGMTEEALALLGGEAEPEGRAVVLERLGQHRWIACDATGSREAREEAVSLLANRPPSAAQALALAALGRHQMLIDCYVDAVATLRRALEVAGITGSLSARTSALSGLGFALVKLGHVDEGVEAAHESLAVARQEGTADAIGRAYVNLTATLLGATRCDEAVAIAAEGLEHARRTGMLASDGVLLAYGQAEALSWLGRWDQAAALVDTDALAADRPHGTTGAVLAGRIAIWRGQWQAAAVHRDRAMAGADPGSRAPEGLLIAAQIAAHEGRFDDARAHAGTALEIAGGAENLSVVALAGAIAMEIEADRAECARSGGLRAGPEVAHARDVADDLLDRIRLAFDRMAGDGLGLLPDAAALLASAEAEHERAWGRSDPDKWAAVAERWDGLGYPYPAAVARYREADAQLRTRGHRERAAAAARSALATATRLDALPLADELRLLAQRARIDLDATDAVVAAEVDPLRALGISARESEVLDLLAMGRTNRQIGEALFISEKTASVHVSNLLRKLNVASRIEAAAIAQRLRSA
jgi:DNA-binding CsgD family transcriptional regulator